MKYEFIDKNKAKHSVEKMTRIFKISRCGYYSWKKRPLCKTKHENIVLLKECQNIHHESHGRYGSPRIHQELKRRNYCVGLNRVARIMRENGIRSKMRKKYKPTTNSKHENPICENILNRKFTVQAPNKVWVSDITFVYTREGWLYLCVIIDLYSRNIVGWNMGNRIDTELLIKAFLMALLKRKPGKDLIFHSDRGVQYTSKDFQKILLRNHCISSMSRKGNCWDNACAESFFHSLKTELIFHEDYKTRKDAIRSIFEYIEIFYNRKRLHSYLGYKSPLDFENIKKAS